MTNSSSLTANNQFSNSSMEMIEPELIEALSRVSSQLDTLVEQSLNDQDPAKVLAERLSAQLGEVKGVFTMLDLPVAADLAEQLRQAIEKVCNARKSISEKEYQALFSSAYLLPRFFEYICLTGVTSPLLLAPCFYSLASAGFSTFIAESELAGFSYNLKVEKNYAEATAETSQPPAELSSTFRRLRQMYQTGLIGMLRDDDVSAKLVLLDRVASRCIKLCADSKTAIVWRLVKRYIEALSNGQLELTSQRRYFFAKFDRSLKILEKDPVAGANTLPEVPVLRELTFLLLLVDSEHNHCTDLSSLAVFGEVSVSDNTIVEQRQAMERSTHKALLSMLAAIEEELGGAKRILDMMSESGVCENSDIAALIESCERIAAVLSMGSFSVAAKVITESVETIASWRDRVPEQEELLDVANMMLYVESALLTGSLVDQNVDADKNATVARGLLQQAQVSLYREAKANIGLAKRSLTSYLESNFDSEHIANVSHTLNILSGAFDMVGIANASELMKKCSVSIDEEYKNPDENSQEALETLADALISAEYLLDELESGRGIDGGISKLIDDSLVALA